MLRLDKFDLRIIYELDKESKISLTSLAKKIGRSKQFVLHRIKNLENDGVIKGYTAIVDMSKLGYFTFRVYFKMKKTIKDEGQKFVNFVHNNYRQVWTITSMHGKWDYALFLGVRHIMEFHRIWDGIMLKYKKRIKEYNVAVYAPIYNFNRQFDTDEKKERFVRAYGEGSLTEFDKLDWRLIEKYAPNVRKSILEISRDLKVSPKTIKNRINKLEQSKIITGYKIGIDLTKLGYVSYRVDLELSSTKENERLFEYCKSHRNIYQINKTIGGADFEIEVIVRNLQELLSIIDDIKKEFKNVVDSADYFGFSTFHILQYIPD